MKNRIQTAISFTTVSFTATDFIAMDFEEQIAKARTLSPDFRARSASAFGFKQRLEKIV